MEEANDLVLPFRGKKMRPARATDVARRSEKITEVLVKGAPYCEVWLQKKCADYRRQLCEVIVGLEDMSFEVSQEENWRMDNAFNGGPSASSSPISEGRRQQGRENERDHLLPWILLVNQWSFCLASSLMNSSPTPHLAAPWMPMNFSCPVPLSGVLYVGVPQSV